jgi:hypothetical protein
LLTEYQRPYNVMTLGFVNCYKLDKSDLTALLESEQHPLIKVSCCLGAIRVSDTGRDALHVFSCCCTLDHSRKLFEMPLQC